VRGLAGEASLCRNEVSSLAHWFLRGTKERRATHSHVFHLYSSGGNGAASDAASCWRAPVKPFPLLRSRPLGPPWPAEADLNASYVFADIPAALLVSEPTLVEHSSPGARQGFHPSATEKSRVPRRASSTRVHRRDYGIAVSLPKIARGRMREIQGQSARGMQISRAVSREDRYSEYRGSLNHGAICR